ncbi:hypothetical protein GO491_09690 [Flavobacteriaceae bacterium Ap0902]|nr:hypothetical protein [Flavobacteriaceae bacterium Ap0902]
MKKIILLSGFLLSSALMNANAISTNVNSDDDIIARKQVIAYNTQIFKTQILKIQLKQAKSLDQSIRILKELKNTVENMEMRLK